MRQHWNTVGRRGSDGASDNWALPCVSTGSVLPRSNSALYAGICEGAVGWLAYPAEDRLEEMIRQYLNRTAMVTGLLLTGCHSTQTTAQETPSTTLQWITPAVSAPRLRHCTFYSAAAESDVSYHIYIPELYDKEATGQVITGCSPASAREETERFPVLFWLHGHGGGLNGIPYLVEYFDSAIRTGEMPPVLIIFPNGLFESMWCNSKDGRVPMETIVVEELVPHIDSTFRTIASREARLIEGFSMGGYGAARLGFRYHDIFGAVSILGAGPMQREFSPSVGPSGMTLSRTRVLRDIYGSDQEYFITQSPWMLAEQNTFPLSSNSHLRIVIGECDEMLSFNRDFCSHLMSLGIPHTFEVLPDIGHNTMALLNALGDSNWEFYRDVFSAGDSADGWQQ